MEIKTIRLQSELDDLLQKFDWSHSFIREVFMLSPSYINPKNLAIVAPDSKATVKVLIAFQDKTFPGLELIFEEVKHVSFSFQVDLEPVGKINERDGSVKLKLHKSELESIQAKMLQFALLDEQSWGWKLKYGIYNLFDEGGVPST